MTSLESLSPGAVIFETSRLIVRRYDLSDAPSHAAAANHAEVTTYMRNRFPSPYSLADAESFIKGAIGTLSGSQALEAAILLKPEVAGNTSLTPLIIGGLVVRPYSDIYHRTCEIGYWLTPSEWGKGFATEAIKALTLWVFEVWPQLIRQEAMCFAGNAGSIKVLKRCGFVVEGMRRDAVEKKGVVTDEVILALLRRDIEM